MGACQSMTMHDARPSLVVSTIPTVRLESNVPGRSEKGWRGLCQTRPWIGFQEVMIWLISFGSPET